MAVPGGAQVAHDIAEVLHHWSAQDPKAPDYAHVVATKDHHIDPGSHWSENPDFVDSWPVHCKVGTDGEAFHPNLDPQPFDAIFLKGERAAAYSGFEGRTTRGAALADWLREHEVTHVDVCGIATDYCVRHTALDAAANGFETTGPDPPQCRHLPPDHEGRPRGPARRGRHHWLTSTCASRTARSG